MAATDPTTPANDGPLLLLSEAVLSVTYCSQQDDLSKDTS